MNFFARLIRPQFKIKKQYSNYDKNNSCYQLILVKHLSNVLIILTILTDTLCQTYLQLAILGQNFF